MVSKYTDELYNTSSIIHITLNQPYPFVYDGFLLLSKFYTATRMNMPFIYGQNMNAMIDSKKGAF